MQSKIKAPLLAGACGLLLSAGSALAGGTSDTITVNGSAKNADTAAGDPSASSSQSATMGVLGKRDVLSFVDDGVGIAENDIYKSVFPADLQAKAEEVKQKLISKEIKVDNAMGMETSEVEAIRNAVKP